MAFTNRPVGRGDWARLLPLAEAYYKFDSIAFDRIVTGRAVRRLPCDPSLGRAGIIEAGRDASRPAMKSAVILPSARISRIRSDSDGPRP